MTIFVSVFCAVLINTAVVVLLLAVVRSRLGKQFAEIERRLGHVEKTAQALKSGLEAEATTEQLKRLHRGLVRLQESTERRYGPLVPLAEELREDTAEQRRFLGDYAIARLEQWGERVGVPVSRPTILRLAREVARLDRDAEAPDFVALLAALIALQRWRNGSLHVALDDSQPAWLREVLANSSVLGVAPAGQSAAPADVAMTVGENLPTGFESISGLVCLNPALADGEAPSEVQGCEIVAADNGVVVYKKR